VSDRLLLRAVLVTALLVGLAWLAAAILGDPAYLANEEANARFADGDPRGALARYRALQRERPELVELGVNAGNASYRVGDFARALAEHSAALRASDPAVRATAAYDRGDTLFRLGRYDDARASWVDSLRADPAGRDAKFNIEVVDSLFAELAQQGTPGNTAPQQGQQSPGSGQAPAQRPQQGPAGQQPGQPPPGRAPGGPGQGRPPDPNEPLVSPPPSVGQALGQFRRNLTVEEAFRVLEALRGEQRGVQGLLEGPPRRPGPSGQGPPLY